MCNGHPSKCWRSAKNLKMDKTDACVGITYVYMTAKEIHKDMALKFGGDPCFYATMNKGVVEFKWGTDSTDVDT